VCFDGATLFSCEILEPPQGHSERLMNRNPSELVHALGLRPFVMRFLLDVLQAPVQRRLMAHDNRRTTRHRQLDAHVDVAPTVLMLVWKLEDVRLERMGVTQNAKRDLRGDSGHEYLVV
jgi:hypothetical protein